jgi:hypothetical protein
MIHSFTVTFGAKYLTGTGTPASSTTKTGLHDIAEILLKVALSTINQIIYHYSHFFARKINDTQFHSYFWSKIFDRHGY